MRRGEFDRCLLLLPRAPITLPFGRGEAFARGQGHLFFLTRAHGEGARGGPIAAHSLSPSTNLGNAVLLTGRSGAYPDGGRARVDDKPV